MSGEELGAENVLGDGLDALADEVRFVDQQTAPGSAQAESEPASPGASAEFIPAADALESARADAAMYMGGLSEFLQKKWGIGLSDATRARGVAVTAPLLVKYDLDSPFIRKWRAEIVAGIFFGSTAYGIYCALKEREKAAAEVKPGGEA